MRDAITTLNGEARKSGKSYGQLQAERYEKQVKLELLMRSSSKSEQVDEKPERPKGGRYQKPKTEGWEEIVDMVFAKDLNKTQAAQILRVSLPTLNKWMAERVSNSASC